MSDLPRRLRSVRQRADGGATPDLSVLDQAAEYIEVLEQRVRDLRDEREERESRYSE